MAAENKKFKAEVGRLNESVQSLDRVKEAIEVYGRQANMDFGRIMEALNQTLSDQKKASYPLIYYPLQTYSCEFRKL